MRGNNVGEVVNETAGRDNTEEAVVVGSNVELVVGSKKIAQLAADGALTSQHAQSESMARDLRISTSLDHGLPDICRADLASFGISSGSFHSSFQVLGKSVPAHPEVCVPVLLTIRVFPSIVWKIISKLFGSLAMLIVKQSTIWTFHCLYKLYLPILYCN